MSPTLESLARQLAAHPRWDWPIGMVAVDPVGRRCWQRVAADRWFCVETARVYRTAPAGLLPLLDYYTAAALLLVLAREVSDDPHLRVWAMRMRIGEAVWYVAAGVDGPRGMLYAHRSEVEALAAVILRGGE